MKVAAARLTAAALLTTGACGSDDITVPTEKGEVSVSYDGEINIESEDGKVSGGSGKLPDGFPTGQVPLIEREVLAAVAVDQTGGGGWSVSIMADGTVDDLHDQAATALESAGFRTEASSNASGVAMKILTNDTYRVLVGATPQDNQAIVQYVEKLTP